MTGSEELLKLRKKLGEEKFEMAIQMYNYFEDVLGKLAVEGEGASATTNDEQTNHLIDQLQQEVYELRSRVLVLEKLSGVTTDISLWIVCGTQEGGAKGSVQWMMMMSGRAITNDYERSQSSDECTNTHHQSMSNPIIELEHTH